MKYLFCYFVGNNPEDESVHFAVSDNADGPYFEPEDNSLRKKVKESMAVAILSFLLLIIGLKQGCRKGAFRRLI